MTVQFKKNDRVYVSFISESHTKYSGIVFEGHGYLDLVDEDRVYGRLDNGSPFSCFPSDCKLVPVDSRFSLIIRIGLKNSRDMLNGYIAATEDLIELRKQYDAWHAQDFSKARVSPHTKVIEVL